MKKHLVLVAAIVLLAIFACFFMTKTPKETKVFGMLFPGTSMPQSFRPIACGIHTPIMGGGVFIIVFGVSKDEILNLASSHGFNPADIDDYTRDLCSSLIADYANTNLVISSEFQYYTMTETNRHAQLFFDTNRDLAVVIGSGAFRKYGNVYY